jgi:hypothetical protein
MVMVVDDPEAAFAKTVAAGAVTVWPFGINMVGAWEGSSIRTDASGRLASRYPESKQRPRLFLNLRNAFLSAIDCRNSLGAARKPNPPATTCHLSGPTTMPSRGL